jgi:hypothetical protein
VVEAALVAKAFLVELGLESWHGAGDLLREPLRLLFGATGVHLDVDAQGKGC